MKIDMLRVAPPISVDLQTAFLSPTWRCLQFMVLQLVGLAC